LSTSIPNAPKKAVTVWRVRVFAVTWMSYAGFYFCRKAFGIVKPVLEEDYGFTSMDLAWCWGTYLTTYMLGQFLASKMGQRWTCRTLLLGGMAVSLMVNLFIGFSTYAGQDMFWWLVIFLGINGFAQATGWPGNVGILTQWTRSSERGRIMGWWGTCYMLGSMMAKHFAAFMLGWLGLAWSFWGASAVLFGVWVLFYFWGKDQPEDVDLPPFIEEVSVEGHDRKAARPWSEVVHIVFMMGLLYFCFKFTRYAADSWGPTLLKDFFTGPDANVKAGHWSTIFDWVGFLGVIVGGYASDKLFRSRRLPVIFYMTALMFIVTCIMALYGEGDLWVFLITFGLLGFAMMGPDSLLSGTAAMDISTRDKAVVASAIINGLGSIGPIVQEFVIAYLRDTGGTGAVLMLLVGIAFMALLGTAALWRYTHKRGIEL